MCTISWSGTSQPNAQGYLFSGVPPVQENAAPPLKAQKRSKTCKSYNAPVCIIGPRVPNLITHLVAL